MAEIKLFYNSRNKFAKKTIDYILSLGIFKEVKSSNNAVDNSLKEIKKGKLNSYKDSSELFKKVLDV